MTITVLWCCLSNYFLLYCAFMIIKNEKELKILREGGKILASLLKLLANETKEGVSSLDLENLARLKMKEFGVSPATLGYTPKGSRRPYPAALCVSVNDVIVHGIPNEKPTVFKEGDLVAIDCVIEYKGLFVDSALTVGVGNISKQDQKLIDATVEARQAGIAKAKAGVRVGEINKAVSEVAQKYGFSLPPELGGHGVGKSIHERPFVGNYDGAPDSDYILKEGEVITVEPMLSAGSAELELLPDGYSYRVKDGSQTAHFEHTIVVTKNGAEILTKL